MEEKIYYQDQNVLVTNSRFVTGDKTYAMRNISSVSIGIISPNNTVAIIVIIFAFLLVILGSTTTKLIGAGIIILFGYIMYQNKPKYTVRINSNSGEVNSLISNNREYIQQIVSGVTDAIIGN